jgi:anti-sigma B factor antagonist
VSQPFFDPSDDTLVEVRLLGVPVSLWKRTSIHHEGVNREFEIIRAGLPDDAPPNRLHQLVKDVEGRFGDLSGGSRELLESALANGEEFVDLTFRVPGAVAKPIGELADLFEDVDAFCAQRVDLLSLASSDDMVEFRRWFLSEFTRQIEEGLPPKDWRGEGYGEPSVNDGSVVLFEGELDISTAERLRSAITRLRAAVEGDVTVDLSGLTFVDSVGLSLLVMAHSSFQAEARSMRIVMPEALRPLLNLSGLEDVLHLEFVAP